MRRTSARTRSSRCCARWVPKTCSTPSTAPACRARSKPRGVCIRWAPASFPGMVMGPCETLNPEGLAFLLELGADLADKHGDRLAPRRLAAANVLPRPGKQTSLPRTRRRSGASLCPTRRVMAMHRGRIDLLEAHLRRDPQLFSRTFSHEEIYPPELGCQLRPFLGAARHAAGRNHSAAHLRRFRRNRDCALADRARRRRERAAPKSMPTASAATRRCSAAWSRKPTSAACSATPLSPACCSITAPIPTLEHRCASACASSPTNPCTNTATSRPCRGANAFTALALTVTPGSASRRCS